MGKNRSAWSITACCRGIALFLSFICLLSGCGSDKLNESSKQKETITVKETDINDQNPVNDSINSADREVITCSYDMEKAEYLDYIAKLETDDKTLVMYTSYSYSNDGIKEVNHLLKKKGYDWKIQIRQIPIEYLADPESLIQDLEKKKIPADIVGDNWKSLSHAAEKGFFVNLDQYLKTDLGKKMISNLPEKYWKLTQIKGKQYFVGNMDFPNLSGWAVNKELMDKYEFSVKDLSRPLEELEDVFKKVWEGEKDEPKYEGDFTPFVFEPPYLLYSMPNTRIVETMPIGFWTDDADKKTDKKVKVVNLFDTEEMRNLAETMNDYYQKGYVKRPVEGIPGSRSFFMQTDFNGFAARRKDYLDSWTNTGGIVLERIPYYDRNTYSHMSPRGNAVLKSSAHQKEALEFLTLAMTDTKMSDLLLYGKEGVDYNRTENGAIDAAGNLSEHYSMQPLGNVRISSIVDPYEDKNKKEMLDAALDAVSDSPIYGFQFDETPVQAQMDAIRKLDGEMDYFQNIFLFEKKSGSSEKTWEECYEHYNQRLKKAGINEIIDEINRQLAEYWKERS